MSILHEVVSEVEAAFAHLIGQVQNLQANNPTVDTTGVQDAKTRVDSAVSNLRANVPPAAPAVKVEAETTAEPETTETTEATEPTIEAEKTEAPTP